MRNFPLAAAYGLTYKTQYIRAKIRKLAKLNG